MNINGQFLDFVRTGRSLKAIPMTPTAIAPASPRAEPRGNAVYDAQDHG